MTKEEYIPGRCPLILEGGAMRGVFEAGVLDVFIEKGLRFERVVGTSVGAMQAVCYLSGQKGWNIRTNKTYCDDPRYMGWTHFFKEKSYFNFDFILDEIACHLDPIDWDSLCKTKTDFYAVATDAITGKGVFLKENPRNRENFMTMVKASASIPFLTQEVMIEGTPYVDGGVGFPCVPLPDELPFHADKAVYILTREEGFQVKEIPSIIKKYASAITIPHHPKLLEILMNIPNTYNHALEILEQMEKDGRVFILRPSGKIKIGRAEVDKEKIQAFYDEGYHLGQERFDDLLRWIHE